MSSQFVNRAIGNFQNPRFRQLEDWAIGNHKTQPGWGLGWGGLGFGVCERAERGAEPRTAGAQRPKVFPRNPGIDNRHMLMSR